jgi:hypothetical protein
MRLGNGGKPGCGVAAQPGRYDAASSPPLTHPCRVEAGTSPTLIDMTYVDIYAVDDRVCSMQQELPDGRERQAAATRPRRHHARLSQGDLPHRAAMRRRRTTARAVFAQVRARTPVIFLYFQVMLPFRPIPTPYQPLLERRPRPARRARLHSPAFSGNATVERSRLHPFSETRNRDWLRGPRPAAAAL